MSRRYSPDHKELVLRVFAILFECNAAATSKFTGIPERTIRDWFYADLEAMKREGAAAAAAAGTPPVPAESVATTAKFSQRR